MKVTEVILEISQAEKRRRDDQRKKQEFAARQQAQRDEQERKAAADQARKELARRKIAAQLRVPEPPPPVEDEPKFDPDNPLAAFYAQQQDQEREQEDEIYGVDFKFQTVIDKKNRTKRLYGFWTRERIQRLEDVMRSGQYRDFGDFKGTNEEAISMFQLMKEIGEKYRQVYVFFDRENMQQFPGLREVLNRFKDNYKITRRNKIPFGYRLNPDNNEIEQFIAWEEVDRPPESFMFKEDVNSSGKKLVIHEFLNEIERTPTFKNDWELDQETPKVDRIPKGSKKFPGYPNFVYYDINSAGVGWKLGNYRTVVVIDRRNRNLVAKLTTQPTSILPGAVEESSINVFDPYQRQGIAASLYHLIAVDRNTPIIADREGGQTPEARKLWVGLWQGRMPDVVVKGYVTIDIDNYFFQDIEKTVINYIMKLGGQWLYRTPKKWVVAFDMMPNRAESELTAAIQNELSSKVYHSEQFQGSDLFDDSGLVAMSTAKWEKLTGYSPE